MAAGGGLMLEPVPAVTEGRAGYTVTGHQSITGLTQRDTPLTPTGNLKPAINLTA